MIVLDASALIELLLNSAAGQRVASRIENDTLHAPHLIDVETLQVLRRLARLGELSDQRAEQALAHLSRLRLARYPHAPLAQRVWLLRKALTAYDAVYVALAERLHAPLVTLDHKLARSTGHAATVEIP